MIKLELTGRIGKDAEIKPINGVNYLSFSVAVTNKIKQNGQTVDQTIWVDCLKKDENGKLWQYLTKGTQVYVSGKPKANAYTTQGGDVRATLNVLVFELELLGSKQEAQPTQQQYQQPQQQFAPNSNSDDLPF